MSVIDHICNTWEQADELIELIVDQMIDDTGDPPPYVIHGNTHSVRVTFTDNRPDILINVIEPNTGSG